MPWKLRKKVYLVLLSVAVMTLGSITLAQNQSLSTELLGTATVVVGLALVILILPDSVDKENKED